MPGQVHLLVLIHGMWGNPGHLAEAHRIMDEIRVQPAKLDPDGVQLRMLVAKTNSEDSTYDGIDWGGERVAKEVFDEMDKVKEEGGEVARFSLMGYSLGGLVARYVIGIMHQRGMFETIKPVNFQTIATPHVGLLRYPTLFSRMVHTIGTNLLSRTGEQFFGVDKWSQRGRPLIEVMADPQRVFYQGLALFEHIRIYANALNDITVPYVTAAIEYEDTFADYKVTGLQAELMEGYAPVMKSWVKPDTPPPPQPKPVPLSPAWFKAFNVPLPPRFEKNGALKVLIIAALPILFPTFLTLVMIRLTTSSRASRERLKLLEKGDSPRLLTIVAELEREIEDLVMNVAEDAAGEPADRGALLTAPGPLQDPELALSPTPSTLPSLSSSSVPTQSTTAAAKSKLSKHHPLLSPVQRRIIAHLNSLPQLRKERVWIPDVRNSHATIIARDIKSFSFHEIGHGVLRHWADTFIL